MMFVIRVFPGNLEPGYIRKGGVGWVYTADLLEAFCWMQRDGRHPRLQHPRR
jgi:hypothetical protein